MTYTDEWGAVREAWFAPTAAGTKSSFLINDATTHEQSAPTSRNLRLGDSIDTGPYSTFSQTSWVGGQGARDFEDKQMFFIEAGADTTSSSGRIRHWPGWRNVYNVAANAVGNQVTKLWSGLKTAGVPQTTSFWAGLTSGDVIRFDSFGSAAALVGNIGAPVSAVCQVGENDGVGIFDKFFIGNTIGGFYFYDTGTNVFTPDGTCPGNGGIQGIATLRNVTYVLLQSTGLPNNYPMLYKRTRAGGVTTWTKMWDFTQMARGTAIEVWNGTLYISGVTDANETIVYSSDGTTAVEAFRIADFQVKRLQVHYGSLYLGGDSIVVIDDAFPNPLRHTKLYKYNGTSLTTVFDQGHGFRDTLGYGTPFGEMDSWGKYLIWTRDYASLTDSDSGVTITAEPGVMLYDAENDAIHSGPSIMTDPAGLGSPDHVYSTALCIVDDRPVVAWYDGHNYGGGITYPLAVGILRSEGYVRNVNFGYGGKSYEVNQTALMMANVYSALYDGGLPGEDKAWLTAVVKCKLPIANTSLDITILTNNTSISKSINYDAAKLDWRTERVTLASSITGDFLKGKDLRVLVSLRDNNSTNTNIHRAEVDGVAVQFVNVPQPRKQWRWQVNLSDGQKRLDGSANPLTTRAALAAKLKEYWSSGVPVAMWLPSTGGTPGGAPDTYVQILDFSETSYREDSTATRVTGAMSVTLLEVV